MGAKTYKCIKCSKVFANERALKRHTSNVHKSSRNKIIKLNMNRKQEISEDLPKKSTKKFNRKAEMQNILKFQCPLCKAEFKSALVATKHIQTFHHQNKCNKNNIQGKLPIMVEECCVCDKTFKSGGKHECLQPPPLSFICTACDKSFVDIQSFDSHALKFHREGLESFYFPNIAEFLTWKDDMEKETCIKYSLDEEYANKTYYHCNYCNYTKLNITEKKKIYFCPSIIVVQTFAEGIQTHFYKNHYKHCVKEYTMDNRYKKYLMTNVITPPPQAVGLDDDLYLRFKQTMESIVLDAAKINIDGLKVLIGQALEMSSVLSSYDEEHEESPVSISVINKSLTDSQISEELEGDKEIIPTEADVTQPQIKRSKRLNPEGVSPKIVNSFSLNKKAYETSKIEEIAVTESSKSKSLIDVGTFVLSTPTKQPPKQQPITWKEPSVTFNDTYKDFVTRNFDTKKKKEIVKTKIGQFKPNMRSPDKFKTKTIIVEPNDALKSILGNGVDSKASEVPSPDNKLLKPISMVEKAPLTENKTTKPDKKPGKLSSVEKASSIIKNKAKKSTSKIKRLVHTTENKLNKSTSSIERQGRTKEKKKVDSTLERPSPVLEYKSIKRTSSMERPVKKIKPTSRESSKDSEIREDTFVTPIKSSPKRFYSEKHKSVLKEKKAGTPNKNVQTDFEYEVIEQESDCNILVLKF